VDPENFQMLGAASNEKKREENNNLQPWRLRAASNEKKKRENLVPLVLISCELSTYETFCLSCNFNFRKFLNSNELF
jgi:hypothetical protein